MTEEIIIHELSQGGKSMFKGTHDSCLMKLQRLQHASADRALKQGWKIEPIETTEAEAAEILKSDPYCYVGCLLEEDCTNFNGTKWVKVKVHATGEIKRANVNAMTFSGYVKGSIVHVMQSHLTDL